MLSQYKECMDERDGILRQNMYKSNAPDFIFVQWKAPSEKFNSKHCWLYIFQLSVKRYKNKQIMENMTKIWVKKIQVESSTHKSDS